MVITLIDGIDNQQIDNFSKDLESYFETLPNQYTIHYIHASKLSIQPCKECFRCWIYSPGTCFFSDDMKMILESIQLSDITFFLSELSNQSFSDTIQTIMSRTVPLARNFVDPDGRYSSNLKSYNFGFILADPKSLDFQLVEQIEKKAYNYTNLLGKPQKLVFYGDSNSVINQLNHFIRIH